MRPSRPPTWNDLWEETLVPLESPTVTARLHRPVFPLTLHLDDFQLIRKLGEGGMGTVYLAHQKTQGRQVALKVPTTCRGHSPDAIHRFYREAQVLASLHHPGIVEFLGAGEERGVPFFAMEYIEGFSAAALQHCLHHPLTIGDALHLALKCLYALRYAHAKQVVHRDIKPQNIMITTLGKVKITDLGLARPMQDDLTLTETGLTVGTPRFMAPEQARDPREVDARSDIYALGGVLYLFLIGRAPFEEDSAMKLQLAKERGLFPSPRRFNPDVPPRLCLILDRMLARDPEDRFKDCAEAIAALESLELANPFLSFNPLQIQAMLTDPTDHEPGVVEILMVHDDQGDIDLARQALAERNIRNRLTVLANGLEAEAYLGKRGRFQHAPTPDLIVVGGNLEEQGILDVLLEARNHPHLRQIPLVVLASSTDAREALEAHDLHVDLTIQQPEDLEQFEILVQSLEGMCLTLVEMPR